MIQPGQTIASIVLEHAECAVVLQRHRIDYCCRGEMSLAVACRERGLATSEVIGKLEQAISDRHQADPDLRRLSSAALIAHLMVRYHAPLRDTLPLVRGLAAKVARVHGERNAHLVELNETVTELADALEAHVDDEELRVFPRFTGGAGGPELAGDLPKGLRDAHATIGALLHRVRRASEDYAVPDWACTSYRTLFRTLEQLETDILRHVHLENHVLLPRLVRGARCAC